MNLSLHFVDCFRNYCVIEFLQNCWFEPGMSLYNYTFVKHRKLLKSSFNEIHLYM